MSADPGRESWSPAGNCNCLRKAEEHRCETAGFDTGRTQGRYGAAHPTFPSPFLCANLPRSHLNSWSHTKPWGCMVGLPSTFLNSLSPALIAHYLINLCPLLFKCEPNGKVVWRWCRNREGSRCRRYGHRTSDAAVRLPGLPIRRVMGLRFVYHE